MNKDADEILFRDEVPSNDADEILFRDEIPNKDADEILFGDEVPEPEPIRAAPWKVLIVDDEADVHSVTTFMLKNLEYQDRGLEFLHAYSGAEAKELLRAHPDIAVVLLDVVMETDDSGLRLVQWIREELGNFLVRIVLRTGQPGKAPAAKVIVDYDINDYKEKTELGMDKMLVTMISALRGYASITMIEKNRRGLRRILDASADIFEPQSLEKLGAGVLGQLTDMLRGSEPCSGLLASGRIASGRDIVHVVVGNGRFAELTDLELDQVADVDVQAVYTQLSGQEHGFIFEEDRCGWLFTGQAGITTFLYLEGCRQLDENGRDLLELFFANVSLAVDNLLLNKGIEDAQKELIFNIAETMECRSAETGSHVRRVAEYTWLLALKYGLDEEEAEMLKLASTPHDLGKVGIPDSILNKPGPLTPEEYQIIKTHVHRGHDLLVHSSSPMIRAAAYIILEHHERWDGTGYPKGLRGEEIHLYGRIVAVADVFDALSNKRVYHEAWSWDSVFAYFEEQRGKHFDPRLVDLLLENREAFMDIWLRYKTDDDDAPSLPNDA
ncbi:MAG: DUF3369 domain-containing protein [Desulfobulbus sp.]|jgi:response regulator RpfG family c-di-GMP phosphodiesterase